MSYSGESPTLSLVICQPFFDALIVKPTLGKPYIREVDLRLLETQLYAIGASLGCSLSNKLNYLGILLTTRNTNEQERNRIMETSKKYAEMNLKEFINEFGHEPNTFVDLMLSKGLKQALGLSPTEAFKAFLSGDKKVNKLFATKVASETIGDILIIMLFQGIQFGSSFPKLTERMYEYHFHHPKDYWGNTFTDGVDMPNPLRVKSFKETASTYRHIVESYTSQYFPELLEPLGFVPPWGRELDATNEITKAIELVTKRAHTPGIDGKELTLLVALQLQLTNLLTAEQMMGELIVEMKLSLLKGENLGEISQENILNEREHIEKQKAKFQKMVMEDKEKVRNMLNDLRLT